MRIYMGVQPIVFVSDALLAHQLMNVHGVKTAHRPDHIYWSMYQSRKQGLAFNDPNICWKKIRQACMYISIIYVVYNHLIMMR